MENWGMVTYPIENFIYDSAVDTDERKMNATELIAHELTHQWFGNLVTPKWWSQLWLSEGFATLFSFIVVDSVLNTV